MSEYTQKILNEINTALGGHAKYFDVKPNDVLSDAEPFAQLFSFKPKKLELEDATVKDAEYFLEFVCDGDECYLILGEDEEHEISFGRLYSSLYWSEVVE